MIIQLQISRVIYQLVWAMSITVILMTTDSTQGRMQEFSGGGAKKEFGGQITCKMCPTWGTFSAKPAPPGALSPQNLPHLGHFLRKMCPIWGTLSVKCALPGALYAIQPGILGQGAGRMPPSPRPCIRLCNTCIKNHEQLHNWTMITKGWYYWWTSQLIIFNNNISILQPSLPPCPLVSSSFAFIIFIQFYTF